VANVSSLCNVNGFGP